MKQLVLPNQIPIVQVRDSGMFDQFDNLEGFLELFPYSDRDAEFVKERVDNKIYVLWVAHTRGAPVGYLLSEPNHLPSREYTKPRFYVAERFVDKRYREMLICSRLVGITSKFARKMKRKIMYEEVDTRNELGMKSSERLGFKEIAVERRGPQYYSLRKKSINQY